jgi:hypothetical protein
LTTSPLLRSPPHLRVVPELPALLLEMLLLLRPLRPTTLVPRRVERERLTRTRLPLMPMLVLPLEELPMSLPMLSSRFRLLLALPLPLAFKHYILC